MTKDMTTGSEMKHIISFMIPVLLGNWFQNFYNITDSIIVGQFLGVNALAAIGLTTSIVFFVNGWIMGLTSGFGILISQAYGARKDDLLKHYVAMSVYLCVIFAIFMTVGLTVANENILHLMNTPSDIFFDTAGYIGIIYLGLPAMILYNMLAAIARALGDSKTPLLFLALSSILNIALDFLFVAALPFGVAGAGYATVLAQAVSAILCFIYVYKKYPEIRFSKKEGQFKLDTVGRMMNMGIPMALQFSITAIGTMIVQSSLNLLGATYIAAYAAAMKIQSIIIQVVIALGAAIATFVGQNFGAGNIDRVKKGVRNTVILSLAVSVIMSVLAYYVCPEASKLFAEDSTGLLKEYVRQVFHMNMWFYAFVNMIFIYRNALQGLGNGIVPMMGGVFELIARALGILFLFESLQFTAICLCDPLAWISALIPLIPYYYWYIKKLSKKTLT